MDELIKENVLLKEQMETMVEAQVCLFTCLFAHLFVCSFLFLIVILNRACFCLLFSLRVQFS